MGNFDCGKDRAVIHNGEAQIIGVSDIKTAAAVAKELQSDGVSCIELCGAFGEDGARAIISATENKIPVGYITHLKEQDDVYSKFFAE